MREVTRIHGRYFARCIDRYGRVKWEDSFDNVICTIGKNTLLDAALAGSSYTVTGPYMGLISGQSFTQVAASDTMASHSGWLEAGQANLPTYSGGRITCVWSAAAGGHKGLSASLSFTFTANGTVQGAFIAFGAGALNTVDNTAGVLLSAGQLAAGARTVQTTDQLNLGYELAF